MLVKEIEPRLSDTDHARVVGCLLKLRFGNILVRFGLVRVDTDGAVNFRVRLGQCFYLGKILALGTDGLHNPDPCPFGAAQHCLNVGKLRIIQVAVRIDEHERFVNGFGLRWVDGGNLEKMNKDTSAHPTSFFSASNINTIMGNVYPSDAAMAKKDLVVRQLGEQMHQLDEIRFRTGFSFNNLALMLASAGSAAPAAVEQIYEALPRIQSLLERKTFQPSSFASALRGKGKRLEEALDILEARWNDLETIARTKTATKLATALNGKSIDTLDMVITRELTLAQPPGPHTDSIQRTAGPRQR